MDSQKLAEMLAAIKERNMNIHSFLVIRNGYLVSESYFRGVPTRHQTRYAIRRQELHVHARRYRDRQRVHRLGLTIEYVEFFPERTFANLDAQKEAMTLEDVLTMRSGLEWQETADTS